MPDHTLAYFVTLTSGIDKGSLNNLHFVQQGYIHVWVTWL